MVNEKACGCVIFDKQTHSKVLLIFQKNDNFWGFPKGHVEQGETEIETALREVKEEIGLDVDIIDEKYRYEMNYYIEKKDVNKTTILFLAETEEKDNLINQEAEIEDSIWIPIDEAVEKLTYDNCKEVIKNAINDMKKC